MPADLPLANNNDNTDEITDLAESTSITINETPSVADDENYPDSDPTTPANITLTSRQQRVLAYLARRRMRHARITKRQTYADIVETMHNSDDEPTPDPHENNSNALPDHNPLWSPLDGDID